MKTAPPLLTAIIVTYNTREMTLRCLETLYAALEGLSHEVIVVDNASTDGTEAAVRARFPQVCWLGNTENRGFGAANNQAMQVGRGEFFLLLNSDAFPSAGSIQALCAYLEAHPDTAVAGPRLLFADGSHQISSHAYESPLQAWMQYSGLSHAADRLRLTDSMKTGPLRNVYLKGACLLVRRAAYEATQGFDEKFFFYCEEADWQKRIQALGWHIAYLDTALVTHLEGMSGNANRHRLTLCYYAATDYFIRKHHGRLGLFVYRLAILLWCLRKIIQFRLLGLQDKAPYKEALVVHRFLLRNLFTVSHKIVLAIPPVRKVEISTTSEKLLT